MRFSFPYSHAFPGGRVAVDVAGRQNDVCTVEFGDGTVLFGRWAYEKDGLVLSVPAYETARGTVIEAKQWRVVNVVADTWKTERRESGMAP